MRVLGIAQRHVGESTTDLQRQREVSRGQEGRRTEPRIHGPFGYIASGLPWTLRLLPPSGRFGNPRGVGDASLQRSKRRLARPARAEHPPPPGVGVSRLGSVGWEGGYTPKGKPTLTPGAGEKKNFFGKHHKIVRAPFSAHADLYRRLWSGKLFRPPARGGTGAIHLHRGGLEAGPGASSWLPAWS